LSQEVQLLNPTLELNEVDAKIGQLFMAGIPGPSLDEGTEALIRGLHIGGVILFSRNIEDPHQVASLCRDLQRTAIDYQGQPLLIAVDQEGGRIARLKPPFTQFPGNSEIGEDDHPDEKAVAFGRTTAREMKLVGLNMDLAPVVDVKKGEPERHLRGRVFGDDPEMVGRLGSAVIKSLQTNGVMAVAKHFPGLGLAEMDPHAELPTINIDLESIEEDHLSPFRRAIGAGVAGIMTSHAVYPALDPASPATLSSPILTGILRERMGFEGLVLSDDLEMGAIAKKWGVPVGASRAFAAGVDVLLVCKEQRLIAACKKEIRARLLRKEIPVERLSQATERILQTKARYLKTRQDISLEDVAAYFHLSGI
jgi:beta-N-acetylhexosaminidase